MTPNQKEAYDHMQKALEKLLPMARKHGTLFGSINPWTEACDIGDTAITAVKKVQDELAQSAEPVAWMYDFRDDFSKIINGWVTRDYDEAHSPTMDCHNIRSLYLHPPQPQATTPSIRQHCSECANWAKAVADTKEWAEGVKIGREIITAAAQGEKP